MTFALEDNKKVEIGARTAPIFAFDCLDKGNPRLCRGRKRAYSEGRSRQEKVSKLE